jgi:hypothetical protein
MRTPNAWIRQCDGLSGTTGALERTGASKGALPALNHSPLRVSPLHGLHSPHEHQDE